MKIVEGLTFDDVLLEPQYSKIESRSQVSVETDLGTLKLKIPIISANMDTVTELPMAAAMGLGGGLGILHRYATPSVVVAWMEALPLDKRCPSIGIKEEDKDKAVLYRKYTDTICVDVAHGDSEKVLEMIANLSRLDYVNIIAGNVATFAAAERLIHAGANIIKVGVGPGSVCTTRIVTGHGVPQLTAIADCSNAAKLYGAYVIADGGIRNSGDIVKALAAGADAVMLGGLLAGTDETPASKMGVFRGMASADAQLKFKGTVGNGTPEGVSHSVVEKGPVSWILNDLLGGVRSGLSYSGAKTIAELQENAIFVRITNNGLTESHPHGAKT